MNYSRILKRSWTILWSYKALWVFGVLLALTSGGGGNGSRVSADGSSFRAPDGQPAANMPEEFQRIWTELQPVNQALSDLAVGKATQDTVNTLIAIGVSLICALLLLIVVSAVVHYVAETALIRMVDQFEATGEKLNWRAGLRLGWSRTAARLFLIDLITVLPILFIVALLIGCLILPFSLAASSGGLPSLAGGVAVVGLIFLMTFSLLLFSILLVMVRQVVYRECALRGAGVIDSLRAGLATVRARIKPLLLMWLLLFGIYLGVSLVLVPVFLIVAGVGLLAGGAAGFGLYVVLQAGSQLTAVLVGIAAGLCLFIALVVPPLAFLRGLVETYMSTAWTLAYRELPLAAAAGPGASGG